MNIETLTRQSYRIAAVSASVDTDNLRRCVEAIDRYYTVFSQWPEAGMDLLVYRSEKAEIIDVLWDTRQQKPTLAFRLKKY